MINCKKVFTSKKLSYGLLILIALILIPQISCSFFESKEDYKKEIELKGIEYSRNSFLNEVKANNKEIVELFIKAGIDLNFKDKDGNTALMGLAWQGNIELSRFLIENGASINTKNELGLLIAASAIGNLELLMLFVEKGADVNAKDKIGMTALLVASDKGQVEIVKFLIAKGADVNATIDGRTALTWALKRGQPDTAELLRKAGAKE